MSGLTSRGVDRAARESIQRSWAGTFAPATQIDWLLLFAALALTLLGFVMIGGATAGDPAVVQGEGNIYIQRQVIAFLLGIVAAAVTTLFDYRNFRAWSVVAYGGAVLLLALVLVAGATVNGAQAWFRIGPLQFQPAEFAKIAIVLMLAAHFHEYREESLGLRALLEALAFALIPMGLILLQPDFGTFIVFAVIVAGILLMAGVHVRYLLGLVAGSVAAIAAALQLGIVQEYQLDRLTAFLDPEGTDSLAAGYNVVQAQIAVGSGRVFGQGLGSGSQTLSGFVPESQTDFIFTVVGEQTGFFGSILVLGLFGILIWRGMRIAATSRDMFGTLISAGVVSIFTFQMFISIGMAIGIMPVTGLPLPFISYGGTSLITSWVLVGLIQNVHMRRYAK
ncbi:rod shape-determining protein RodA [Euzebya tangerina]|uniref:rod shape-determining protein RodA n=1 Tax=Euzebya tangerina TaxID=591198 RepID=UPI000E31FB8E|nr:rod shape-determining protein RodA [Euzebya tangerina]